ncbi:MAG: UDP-3-O-(3-hydroxymyristoyl)glucosamine N-acyltransferase [Ignavibacteriaceae bacterium]|nr:UDP-3-O-(3-hydroxymyristoyl)glucosamine N-acyltransferase [Ignavibacteriaceae bacterium]
MKIKLKEISDFIGGNITGDSNLIITNLSKIEESKAGDLTFLYLPAYEKYLATTKASAIIVKTGSMKNREDISYIEVAEPNKAFFKLVNKYFKPEFPLKGIDHTAFIDPSVKIGKNFAAGKNVVIAAGCVIGDNVKIYHNTVILEDVEIGNDSLLFQNISIREKCIIGNRCIIHANTVIGSDGFGYDQNEKGEFIKIPQIGNVVIEDDVEIGSNVSVDRASIGCTLIKKGTKIDNLSQIAHNVVIGENTIISSQVGISGSTKVGNNCYVLGQVGLTGHIEIGDKVILIAQSGVSKSILKEGTYFGSPAKEIKTAFQIEAHIRNLPRYAEKINQLENQIKQLSEKLEK